MLSQVTHFHPAMRIRRTRSLPVQGSLLVRSGQKLNATETIAEAYIPTRHLTINVFQAFGLTESPENDKIIDCQVGDQLDRHDVIAQTRGPLPRVIRAPLAGKVVSIRNGQVVLEVETRTVSVQSGYIGMVAELIKDHGAVMETNGMLIQGVWGNGKIGSGTLVMDAGIIDQELLPTTLSLTLRGTVLATAFCEKEESLFNAESLPLAGLILGSMVPSLIPLARKMPFPVILIEGFGKTAINDIARNLLLDNIQHELTLNAEKWDHFNGDRPEICVATLEEGDMEKSMVECAVGQMARVHSSPYSGQIGMITAINSSKTTLPNGLRTITASLMINNKNVDVPITNFDIINFEKGKLG